MNILGKIKLLTHDVHTSENALREKTSSHPLPNSTLQLSNICSMLLVSCSTSLLLPPSRNSRSSVSRSTGVVLSTLEWLWLWWCTRESGSISIGTGVISMSAAINHRKIIVYYLLKSVSTGKLTWNITSKTLNSLNISNQAHPLHLIGLKTRCKCQNNWLV